MKQMVLHFANPCVRIVSRAIVRLSEITERGDDMMNFVLDYKLAVSYERGEER